MQSGSNEDRYQPITSHETLNLEEEPYLLEEDCDDETTVTAATSFQIEHEEYLRLKYQLHQYRFILNKQQEQLCESKKILERNDILKKNIQVMEEEIQKYRRASAASYEHYANLDLNEKEDNETEMSDEQSRNCLVNLVVDLTLQLAQTRSQFDYTKLQMAKVVEERDMLRSLYNRISNAKSQSLLQKMCHSSMNSIFRLDTEEETGENEMLVGSVVPFKK